LEKLLEYDRDPKHQKPKVHPLDNQSDKDSLFNPERNNLDIINHTQIKEAKVLNLNA